MGLTSTRSCCDQGSTNPAVEVHADTKSDAKRKDKKNKKKKNKKFYWSSIEEMPKKVQCIETFDTKGDPSENIPKGMVLYVLEKDKDYILIGGKTLLSNHWINGKELLNFGPTDADKQAEKEERKIAATIEEKLDKHFPVEVKEDFMTAPHHGQESILVKAGLILHPKQVEGDFVEIDCEAFDDIHWITFQDFSTKCENVNHG